MTSSHNHGSEIPDALPEGFGAEKHDDGGYCANCEWEAMHYSTRGRAPFTTCVPCQTTDAISLAMHLHLDDKVVERELLEGRLRGIRIDDTWLIHSDSVRAWLNAPALPQRGEP